MARLIGLYGRATSGKGAVADTLVEAGWHRVKFAGPGKAMLRTLLTEAGVDPFEIEEMIEGSLKEVPHDALAGKSPRHAMQTLGTEWGRECMASDLWVSIAMLKVHALMWQDRRVVIDDVRFANEVAAIKAFDGKMVHVVRPGMDAIPDGDHSSEGGLDNVRMHQIINDGTLELLRKNARALEGL